MYFWLKVVHILAMTVWFSGLFFLPRLFVARHRREIDADRTYWNPVTNTLFFRLMTPAQQQALFDNTARAMGDAPDFIKRRHVDNCSKADLAYGAGVEAALRKLGAFAAEQSPNSLGQEEAVEPA